MTVATLRQAVSPAKADILALLDAIREEVESGTTISLVAITIEPNREFHNRSAGGVSMLTLVGVLATAQFDAMRALQTGGG